MNKEKLSNNLTVSIDWLAYTYMEGTPADVIQFMGFKDEQFDMLPKGAMGYKSAMKLQGHDVRIFFDGNEGMGVHVSVSGKAVPVVLEAYKQSLVVSTPWGKAFDLWVDESVMARMLSELRMNARITRLDLAIDDDGGRFFSIEEVEQLIGEGKLISKWKTYRSISDRKLSGGDLGKTLYFGSRASQVFMRLYDKQLEVNRKLQEGAEGWVDRPWYRWELELKDERAQAAADLIVKNNGIGEIAVGILTNYIRFIELDDCNKSRCSIMQKWQEFVTAVTPLRLFMRKVAKTLKDKQDWLVKQCMPTIAGVFLARGGTLDFIEERLSDSIQRMGADMWEIVKAENPQAVLC